MISTLSKMSARPMFVMVVYSVIDEWSVTTKLVTLIRRVQTKTTIKPTVSLNSILVQFLYRIPKIIRCICSTGSYICFRMSQCDRLRVRKHS